MTARSPTTFVFPAVTNIKPGRIIYAAPLDAIYDNLEHFWLKEDMGISGCFRRFKVNSAISGVGTFVEAKRYYLKLRDLCDADGYSANQVECDVAVRLWSDGTATPHGRITSTASASNTVTIVGSASATPAWYSGTLRCKTDDVEDTITVELASTGAGGLAYIGGIFLIARGTS